MLFVALDLVSWLDLRDSLGSVSVMRVVVLIRSV